jgi:hypothetical protein
MRTVEEGARSDCAHFIALAHHDFLRQKRRFRHVLDHCVEPSRGGHLRAAFGA